MRGVVVAGTHSGCGKTTVVLGLLAALKERGYEVQSFKAGPDFIDSGLHGLITGRPCRNLDIWMCGKEYVKHCFEKFSADADFSVVEGVMGMYDGDSGTASLAALLGLPVILVVDSWGMAESAGAVVKGFKEYRSRNAEAAVRNKDRPGGNASGTISGVIFNRVASEYHFSLLKRGTGDARVFGRLPYDRGFEIPQRHLGLAVAEEGPVDAPLIRRLAETALKFIDVDGIFRCTESRIQKATQQTCTSDVPHPIPEVRIAIAHDRAFSFYYEDNLDLLREAGADLVFFSPLEDRAVPEKADALYIGGGYPELHAEKLASNTSMLQSLHEWADAGRPVYAECGGLMYLSRGIYDFNGRFHPMAGVFPFRTKMTEGRMRLGYREVKLLKDTFLGRSGDAVRGHEFHYSEIAGRGREIRGGGAGLWNVYSVLNSRGEEVPCNGYMYKNTLASYVHVHFGSSPGIAENFIRFTKTNNTIDHGGHREKIRED